MVKIMRSLFILATAAFAVAETPTQRCSGYNQLVQCCENVVIANKAPLAALNVDAGPLDPSKYVGLGCSLPRIVIAQSAVSCSSPGATELCCSTNIFVANDGTFTAVNCTMAA
ncbi:uncharacterized protein EV420DRAFT_1487741 [Desarmillaria tabescens]|uniref:Hydrophobin n=1 Tax=Armillaria tabescens TaxID=1929756 RepID=A0AA39MJA9_ARMTA|nr:uncharacterized protein EV420DRAFT_1487741 [Desarmillaria tabescens]KAK0435948.1 hypothetical protein EV420DRAFT_1487741 [Desarmillaria tabescens]